MKTDIKMFRSLSLTDHNNIPTMTINYKSSESIVKPKLIAPRSRSRLGSLPIMEFPAIREEYLIPKPPQTFTSAADTSVESDGNPPLPTPPLTPRGTLSLKPNQADNEEATPAIDAEDEEDAVIELPKKPRFSATMSLEAQYTLMKCYEDIVYDCLSEEYPEHRPALKPMESPRDLNNICDNMKDMTTASHNTNQLSNRRHSDSSCLPSLSVQSNTPAPLLRRTQSSKTFPSSSPIPMTKPLKRSWSVGSCHVECLGAPLIRVPYYNLAKSIPREKQLVMSYRLESAMDILDSVRNDRGFIYTSPRVKAGAKGIKNVKDFNKWTKVWSQEFTNDTIISM